MNEIKRGEIHYVQKVKGDGALPVLILSSDKRNEDHDYFQVANITTKPHDSNKMHVIITQTSNGTMAGSVITVDNVNSVARERIDYPMSYEGRLCDEDMARVEKALRFSLGLDQAPALEPEDTKSVEPEAAEPVKEEPQMEWIKTEEEPQLESEVAALRKELDEVYEKKANLEMTVEIYQEQYEVLLDRVLKKAGI